jgi:ketosteroid isomerase-like protein
MKMRLFLIFVVFLGTAGGILAADGAKEARRAVEEEYARYHQAVKRKDVEAIMALLTPNYVWKLPDGTIYDYHQTKTALESYYSTVRAVTDVSTHIHRMTIKGNRAIAVVTERVVLQTVDSPRTIRTEHYRETWVKTSSGWKIRQTELFKEQVKWVEKAKKV